MSRERGKSWSLRVEIGKSWSLRGAQGREGRAEVSGERGKS